MMVMQLLVNNESAFILFLCLMENMQKELPRY